MGIDCLVCGKCEEGFVDCIDWHWCCNCWKICCNRDDCIPLFDLKMIKHDKCKRLLTKDESYLIKDNINYSDLPNVESEECICPDVLKIEPNSRDNNYVCLHCLTEKSYKDVSDIELIYFLLNFTDFNDIETAKKEYFFKKYNS